MKKDEKKIKESRLVCLCACSRHPLMQKTGRE